MKTLEQERAEDALNRIAELSDKSHEFKKLYRAYVDRLGPTIVMNGLGQALAIERAAAGPQPENSNKQESTVHHEIYNGLKHWLCREGGIYPHCEDLLQAIMKENESYYLRAQHEALAWLAWHKKFCRASFPKEGENET